MEAEYNDIKKFRETNQAWKTRINFDLFLALCQLYKALSKERLGDKVELWMN